MIRSVKPDEWQRFRELRLAALAEAPYAFGSTLEREQGFDEAAWRSRLSGRRQFVAEAGGNWVGTAGVVPADDGEGVELVSMWVAPAARGTGVSADLVQTVIEWARAEDRLPLRLWVAAGNQRAERLYSRLGFERNGEVQPIRSTEPDRLEFQMTLATADS